MTDYYLLPLLSGQKTNINQGKLSFSPLYPCPFRVPLLLSDVTGSVSCHYNRYKNKVFTVEISFGKLTLKSGGLVVNNIAYKKIVNITGDSDNNKVEWIDTSFSTNTPISII